MKSQIVHTHNKSQIVRIEYFINQEDQLTSPLYAFTNASIREKPSKPKEFAIASIRCLHLCKASLLKKMSKRPPEKDDMVHVLLKTMCM